MLADIDTFGRIESNSMTIKDQWQAEPRLVRPSRTWDVAADLPSHEVHEIAAQREARPGRIDISCLRATQPPRVHAGLRVTPAAMLDIDHSVPTAII